MPQSRPATRTNICSVFQNSGAEVDQPGGGEDQPLPGVVVADGRAGNLTEDGRRLYSLDVGQNVLLGAARVGELPGGLRRQGRSWPPRQSRRATGHTAAPAWS